MESGIVRALKGAARPLSGSEIYSVVTDTPPEYAPPIYCHIHRLRRKGFAIVNRRQNAKYDTAGYWLAGGRVSDSLPGVIPHAPMFAALNYQYAQMRQARAEKVAS